jgi:thiol-disulfide isomerase/thioredoxin
MLKTSARRFTTILLLIFIFAVATGCGDSQKKAKVLKTVPAFSLTSLDGKTITNESLKGKVVILDFWATWCPPCRAAIPHLVTLYEKFKDQGLNVVGVSLDKNKSEVVDFIKRNRVPYPIAIGTNNPITKDLGNISSLPTIIVLGQESSIEFKVVGFNAEIGAKLESKIKELLTK